MREKVFAGAGGGWWREMDLSRKIKGERARRRMKRALEHSLFTRIHHLVRTCHLGRDFLKALREVRGALPDPATGALPRVRTKEAFEPPPFSLATREEYLVTMEIIRKANNPYLRFACSPEEIILSRPLHKWNPSLGVHRLESMHFESLLLLERLRKELRKLCAEIRDGEFRPEGEPGIPPRGVKNRAGLDGRKRRYLRLLSFFEAVEGGTFEPACCWGDEEDACGGAPV